MCPEETPRWTDEEWAHTAQSSLWLQEALWSCHQRDACDQCSEEPIERRRRQDNQKKILKNDLKNKEVKCKMKLVKRLIFVLLKL